MKYDLEYYQLRLCQLRKAYNVALVAYSEGSATSLCEVIKDIHYCKRKLEIARRKESMNPDNLITL